MNSASFVASAPLGFTLLLGAAVSLGAGCDPKLKDSEPSLSLSAERPARAEEPPPRPPTPQELAIFAPLKMGEKLLDYDVREIRVQRGTIEVVCEKDKGRAVLSVAKLGSDGPPPPASTDKYAVFYSLRSAPPEDGERLTAALAKLLQSNQSTPIPAGLEPFVPRPHSL